MKLNQAGRSVAVLEARPRIGGRVYTHHLPDGTPINMGGTWIGAGHDRLYALVKELGAETCPQGRLPRGAASGPGLNSHQQRLGYFSPPTGHKVKSRVY